MFRRPTRSGKVKTTKRAYRRWRVLVNRRPVSPVWITVTTVTTAPCCTRNAPTLYLSVLIRPLAVSGLVLHWNRWSRDLL